MQSVRLTAYPRHLELKFFLLVVIMDEVYSGITSAAGTGLGIGDRHSGGFRDCLPRRELREFKLLQFSLGQLSSLANGRSVVSLIDTHRHKRALYQGEDTPSKRR